MLDKFKRQSVCQFLSYPGGRKPDITMDPDSIWEQLKNVYFEKETLVISMFHINPMLTREEIKIELQRVRKDLEVRFDPWINHYVWNESPITFQMTEYDDIDYIYGELVFGDHFADEWLVTQILFDLSKTYEDLYIHLSDNEGEFLLIEGAQYLPDWLEPDNAGNRDWINHGRILIIPEEYYRDRSLKLAEALKFLDRVVYKCLKVEELDNAVINKVKQFPKVALEGQISLEITVPRKIAGVLMRNRVLNQAVLSFGKEINNEKVSPKFDDLVDLKIQTTALAYLFIDYYLKSQNLSSPKTDGGKLVTQAVEKYLKEDSNLSLIYTPSDQDLKSFNEQGDVLQKELIRLMRIDKHVEPNLDFGDLPTGEDGLQQDDEIISRLESFFKDTNAGLDGVETPTDKTGLPKAKIEVVESEPDSDDENEEARKYFKEEGVDISEDDFFEFFAKEGLKLTDEDLETFRNMNLDHEKEPKSDEDEHEDYDSEEEELLQKLGSGGVAESLQELLKSLETEGGMNGPTATLLQSLGLSLPKPKD